MKAGITGYGVHLPRLRMSREAIVKANAWFTPGARGKGERTLANWDEDAITMAVSAARNAMPESVDRSGIGQLFVASTTFPFSDRLNSGVVCEALALPEACSSVDLGGNQVSGLAALSQGLASASLQQSSSIVIASEERITRAGSPQELSYGDGAAAITVGVNDVIAEFVTESTMTVDFVDHFRKWDADIDYHWEERWVRDQGIGDFVPKVIEDVIKKSGITADQVQHFIFPTTFKRLDAQLAKRCGIAESAVVSNLSDSVGDTGTAHGLLMLASALEVANSGDYFLVCQFGSGARAMLFRATDLIDSFRPVRGIRAALEEGSTETNYTRFLAYKRQLVMEQGMRGEQDKKTALSTAYRYRRALMGFVAGRCRETGDVHFPPTQLSYSRKGALRNSQEPYPLADKKGRVLSWSAEYLSSHMSPPHQYGQVDFEGGGRLLMDFTDVSKGDIETGIEVEMVFRIKDVDELRGFHRYFWKATPTSKPEATPTTTPISTQEGGL